MSKGSAKSDAQEASFSYEEREEKISMERTATGSELHIIGGRIYSDPSQWRGLLTRYTWFVPSSPTSSLTSPEVALFQGHLLDRNSLSLVTKVSPWNDQNYQPLFAPHYSDMLGWGHLWTLDHSVTLFSKGWEKMNSFSMRSCQGPFSFGGWQCWQPVSDATGRSLDGCYLFRSSQRGSGTLYSLVGPKTVGVIGSGEEMEIEIPQEFGLPQLSYAPQQDRIALHLRHFGWMKSAIWWFSRKNHQVQYCERPYIAIRRGPPLDHGNRTTWICAKKEGNGKSYFIRSDEDLLEEKQEEEHLPSPSVGFWEGVNCIETHPLPQQEEELVIISSSSPHEERSWLQLFLSGQWQQRLFALEVPGKIPSCGFVAEEKIYIKFFVIYRARVYPFQMQIPTECWQPQQKEAPSVSEEEKLAESSSFLV